MTIAAARQVVMPQPSVRKDSGCCSCLTSIFRSSQGRKVAPDGDGEEGRATSLGAASPVNSSTSRSSKIEEIVEPRLTPILKHTVKVTVATTDLLNPVPQSTSAAEDDEEEDAEVARVTEAGSSQLEQTRADDDDDDDVKPEFDCYPGNKACTVILCVDLKPVQIAATSAAWSVGMDDDDADDMTPMYANTSLAPRSLKPSPAALTLPAAKNTKQVEDPSVRLEITPLRRTSAEENLQFPVNDVTRKNDDWGSEDDETEASVERLRLAGETHISWDRVDRIRYMKEAEKPIELLNQPEVVCLETEIHELLCHPPVVARKSEPPPAPPTRKTRIETFLRRSVRGFPFHRRRPGKETTSNARLSSRGGGGSR